MKPILEYLKKREKQDYTDNTNHIRVGMSYNNVLLRLMSMDKVGGQVADIKKNYGDVSNFEKDAPIYTIGYQKFNVPSYGSVLVLKLSQTESYRIFFDEKDRLSKVSHRSKSKYSQGIGPIFDLNDLIDLF